MKLLRRWMPLEVHQEIVELMESTKESVVMSAP